MNVVTLKQKERIHSEDKNNVEMINEKFLEENKQRREKKITENMGLVYSVVKRFVGRGCDTEDLIQLGSVGLIKAIDRFDESFGVKFSTYAVPVIMGEIRRFFRDDGIIKVSRGIKENQVLIFECAKNIREKTGKDPTVYELSEKTGIPVEDVVVAVEAKCEIESLNKVIYQSDSGEISLLDKLHDEKNENEKVINKLLVEQLMAELEDFEKQLIEMRYFKEMTQTQIAEMMGVSQVKISRMEKKIILKMREKV